MEGRSIVELLDKAGVDHVANGLQIILKGSARGGLVCLNSAARFDKWNRTAVR